MLTIRPARRDEQAAAFRLVFRHLPDDQRAARVANARTLVLTGELDADGILVAEDGGPLLGALVCVPLRGASGLFWPPAAEEGPGRAAAEDALVREALAWLRGRGAKLAQAVLSRPDTALAAPLERNGFRHVTELLYLGHNLHLSRDESPPAALTFQKYDADNHDLFHATLLRTYEGTLDCPELNGVRTVEEIVEGHKAQGEFDPARWWLAREAGRPVGVVIVTRIPEWNAWDLSYLGVVPEARRMRLGLALTARVLREARAAGVGRVTLAVDARNRPAWDLYVKLGFEPFDRREVFLYFF